MQLRNVKSFPDPLLGRTSPERPRLQDLFSEFADPTRQENAISAPFRDRYNVDAMRLKISPKKAAIGSPRIVTNLL
jgi:hypothetical protein